MDLETKPLPTSTTVGISKSDAIINYWGNAVFFVFGVLISILFAYALISRPAKELVLWLGLAAGIPICLICRANMLQWKKNADYAGMPIMVINLDRLVIRKFRLPWRAVQDCLFEKIDTGKGSYQLYGVLSIEPSSMCPTADPTDTDVPWIYQRNRQYILHKLKLHPSHTLIFPIYEFDMPQRNLAILLDKYWQQATGRKHGCDMNEVVHPRKGLFGMTPS